LTGEREWGQYGKNIQQVEMPVDMPAYDPDNIFAKILRKKAPCNFVWEDADTFVFMDIMPRSEGHTLVIPKAPMRNILDAPAGALVPLIGSVQRVAIAAKKAFNADGMTISQFSEPAGGQVVFHLHFHVIPRFEGVALRPAGVMADGALLTEHAAQLRAAIG
jgi:histidine triad (HIT) family protein